MYLTPKNFHEAVGGPNANELPGHPLILTAAGIIKIRTEGVIILRLYVLWRGIGREKEWRIVGY